MVSTVMFFGTAYNILVFKTADPKVTGIFSVKQKTSTVQVGLALVGAHQTRSRHSVVCVPLGYTLICLLI